MVLLKTFLEIMELFFNLLANVWMFGVSREWYLSLVWAFYSKLGVKSQGYQIGSAETHIVAVSLFLSLLDAFHHFRVGVDIESWETGEQNDVLLRVSLIICKSWEIVSQGCGIAISIDHVCSLGQASVSDVELGKFPRVSRQVLDDREEALDRLRETGAAIDVEVRDKAVNDTKEHQFVVNGRID